MGTTAIPQLIVWMEMYLKHSLGEFLKNIQKLHTLGSMYMDDSGNRDVGLLISLCLSVLSRCCYLVFRLYILKPILISWLWT